MAFDLDLVAFEGKQINVGPSLIVGVTVSAFQAGLLFKADSGGTLWVGGATLFWGLGYKMDTKEVISINGRGTFYVAAQGATAVCYLFRGGTQDEFGK